MLHLHRFEEENKMGCDDKNEVEGTSSWPLCMDIGEKELARVDALLPIADKYLTYLRMRRNLIEYRKKYLPQLNWILPQNEII
jgi:hypothetical protein